MRLWLVAGALSVAAFPSVATAERTEICQEDARAAQPLVERAEQTSAPAQTGARPPDSQARSEQAARNEPNRRRSGKRIPDAELIGPRGAL